MTLKSFNTNTTIHYGLNLIDSGLEVISYVDTMKHASDETISIQFSYPELKEDMLNSFIIPKSPTYISHADSIEKGEYILPDNDDTAALLSDVRNLKEFAINLEKELLERVKKD